MCSSEAESITMEIAAAGATLGQNRLNPHWKSGSFFLFCRYSGTVITITPCEHICLKISLQAR